MSDSVVVNVISPEVTNINVTDTGENIYINPLTLNQGIINHSVTHQSGGSDELLHNLLGGLQGGSGGNYYHLTSGQYANLVTGAVIRPSDTGAFYPSYNPSGFITGVDLSAYVTGDVVRPSETGNFITTSQTDAFYPRSNPSGFIVPSQTGAFYAASNPSGFITGVDLSAYVTGDVVRPSQTGAFYPASNPSGFITGVDLSAYVTGSVVRPSETGNFISFAALTGDRGDITITGNSPTNLNFSIDSSAVTNTKIADGAITTAKIASFNVTTDKLGSLAVTTNIIASNAVTNTKLADMASQRIKGRISAGTSDPEDLTASQVRTLIDFDNTVSGLLSGYVTGSVVRPSETGAFYAASNPSGFITGVDLSAYVTGDVVRPSQTGAFYPISNPSGYVTGSVVRPSETGSFITISQTGVFYPTSNPSGFVTGLVVRPSETGSFITTAQTGVFYPASNPSGFATAVDPVRTTLTGNGIVSGYAISGANNLINPSALIVAIDGALQEPSVDYTVNSGQITFTSPLPSGSKAVVISPSNSLIAGQVVPSDGSVTSAKIAGGQTISDLTLASSTTFNSTSYTYGAGAASAHRASLGIVSVSALIPVFYAYATLYTYNVSNQTTNRLWKNTTTIQNAPAITPSASFTKGARGEIIASGNSYTFNNINNPSPSTTYEAPYTLLVVLRPIAQTTNNGIFRHRNWDPNYTTGNLLQARFLGGTYQILTSKVVPTTDFVCIAYTGNNLVQRAAIWHNNEIVSGSSEVTMTANQSLIDMTINAGSGGSASGVEFVAAQGLYGMLSETDLRAYAEAFFKSVIN
jgi:hypothetical protein